MNAAAELGRKTVSQHHIQPEYGDEQADAGRDCRTRFARPNSQARTRTRKFFFPVQLTTSRIGNHTRLIHTLAICVTFQMFCSDMIGGQDVEQTRLKQLQRQVKRERKGAIRELKRDAIFLEHAKANKTDEKEQARRVLCL